MMSPDQLQRAINTRPFMPFVIRVADGREYHVDRSELIGYAGGRAVVVFANPDVVEVLDLLWITSLSIKMPTESQVHFPLD